MDDESSKLVARLRDEIATLEQLLAVHEQTAADELRRRNDLLTALEEKNRALQESEHEKNEALDRLRDAVRQLSTPVLELWESTLALPLIGVLDARRSAEVRARLLQEVTRSQAQFVVLDVTGVDTIDTSTADHLIKIARSVELLGARCLLTGIRPSVAQTLVDVGVDLGSLTTFSKLKDGLRACLGLHSDGAAPLRRLASPRRR